MRKLVFDLQRAHGAHRFALLVSWCALLCTAPVQARQPAEFFEAHCIECHDSANKRGGLDLTALNSDLANADVFAKWVKIHDRIESDEMPPKGRDRPGDAD